MCIPPICSPNNTDPNKFSKTSTEKLVAFTSPMETIVNGVTAPSLVPYRDAVKSGVVWYGEVWFGATWGETVL